MLFCLSWIWVVYLARQFHWKLNFVFAMRLLLVFSFPASDGRCVSFSTNCVSNIVKFVLFETKLWRLHLFSQLLKLLLVLLLLVSLSPLIVSTIFFVSPFKFSLAVCSQEKPSLQGIWIIDAIVGNTVLICVEECRWVNKFKARSWQALSEELYLAVCQWTKSELLTYWPAASSLTKEIFWACWMVVFQNSFKIRTHCWLLGSFPKINYNWSLE